MKPTPYRIAFIHCLAVISWFSAFARIDGGRWLLGSFLLLLGGVLFACGESLILALWAEGIHHGLYQKGRCLHGTKTLREAHSMWERERL